ncbi:MAG: ATP-binding cassette domain-containing protein, partial [Chitinophagales bacterium]
MGDAASKNMDFLHILAGTSLPKLGSLTVLGTSNIASVRYQIGSTFDTLGFIDKYSIEKNIKILCMHKEIRPKEAAKMLHLFDLWNYKGRAFGKCTREQKKRMEIVCALIGNPEIILLDKPLQFLKGGTALIVCKLLLKAAANGQTVFI